MSYKKGYYNKYVNSQVFLVLLGPTVRSVCQFPHLPLFQGQDPPNTKIPPAHFKKASKEASK